MVDSSFVMVMELFEILYKIVDSLRIEKLLCISASLIDHYRSRCTFLITCEGSVLSMAFRYCCIAVS